VTMLGNHFASYFSSGNSPTRKGSSAQGMVPYQAFKAKDDWMVVASFTERMWQGVCAAIEKPEWAADSRFDSANTRYANREELIGLLEGIFAEQTVEFWEKRLRAEGVPFTPINSIDRVAQDEQVLARDMIAHVNHPDAGEIRVAGLPIKLSETPGRIQSPPPLLGEHTLEVLRGLGLSQEDTDVLIRQGAVGVPKQENVKDEK
jgi:crotonobetainyl-CoA:carnitine CoA-transferase CaiB-like acyl-CoA transferase